MKPKKFNKKLALNKKTIANLNNREMAVAIGGITQSITFTRCETCRRDCTKTCDTCWETNCSNPCC
jgi:hypothetical protein